MTKMIDISSKEITQRTARARGEITLKRTTIEDVAKGKVKKGDVLSAAQTAAILAVKNTPNLIPLCHNIPIDCIVTTCAKDSFATVVSLADVGEVVNPIPLFTTI